MFSVCWQVVICDQKKGPLPLFHVTTTTTDCFVFATQKAGKAENKILMI